MQERGGKYYLSALYFIYYFYPSRSLHCYCLKQLFVPTPLNRTTPLLKNAYGKVSVRKCISRWVFKHSSVSFLYVYQEINRYPTMGFLTIICCSTHLLIVCKEEKLGQTHFHPFRVAIKTSVTKICRPPSFKFTKKQTAISQWVF